MHPTAKQVRLRQFRDFCRDNGLPFTAQRGAVLEAALERGDHPSADQVFAAVAKNMPAISRTTVYRTLETLVRIGMIARICHPGSIARYDPRTDAHHHLVCQHCDAVIDITDERLDSIRVPNVSAHGFEIRDFRVQFRGTCKRCRKNKEEVS